MGTSAPSSGPNSKVPFDPPWLDDIEIPPLGDGPPPDDQKPGDADLGNDQPQPSPEPPEVAPRARFGAARRTLGEFARSGKEGSFRRAFGHYSRTGMGGARRTANRMRTSARSGASTFGVLQAARERTNPVINDWVDSLKTRNASAQEIADEIVKRTTSSGGSLDEAACQQSMAQAMGDLLTSNPDVDLFNLADDDIWGLMASFLGYEAFHRLCLDIGQVFESFSFSPRESVTRMNEMRNYLKAELSVQIETLRSGAYNATPSQLQFILQSALENTFAVYEGAI
ncbi:MAG: hypothetical protein OXG94_02500 [Bacteroidetes bacterium]|nr:hypothetical protein [Bacteroidota bacterium]